MKFYLAFTWFNLIAAIYIPKIILLSYIFIFRVNITRYLYFYVRKACTMCDPVALYHSQLSAVEETLKNASEDEKPSLLDLRGKLIEVISLLKGNVNEHENCKTESSSKNLDTNDNKKESNAAKTESGDIDDEFARFQEEINALESHSNTEDIEEVHSELFKVLSSMEGKKCRAPFTREWGERGYHNAIIFSTDLDEEASEDLNSVQVKVMFCNPLCDKMKPCPFFLDGHCKFESEKCRFSHGYSVKYSDLEDYIMPDYSNVQRDSRCLAKYKDGLWYTAVVESCLQDNKFFVKYNTIGKTDTLEAYDILPIANLSLSDDDSSNDSFYDESAAEIQDIRSEEVPTQAEINYVAEVGSSPIGTWEQHTKGIGSKIMAKMGYVWGQGLGKNSDGRIEPVEAIVFPKGKSLDKCAELREISGPVSVEEKFNSEQNKEKERAKKLENNLQPENTVFDFLNKNILNSGSSQNILCKRPSSETNVNPDKKCQETDLNYEMYAVGEDIKNTRKEILRLLQSINRNSDRNEVVCTRRKQQMAVQNSLLTKLEAKEQKISNELNRRKKKKVIF